MSRAFLAFSALFLAVPATAESTDASEGFERMTVVGSRVAAQETAGAASYVSLQEIAVFKHTDLQRVLRQVPGVYVVEEEGFGLRPNIGLRGSGTDRSARITLMEDGVLIAPAPYAASSAYYVPTMQRMHALEIRKGSAAVRHGPRTTGGAVNMISTPIPEEALSGRAEVTLGEDDTLLGHAYAGGRRGQIGFLLEGVRQQTDGFKNLDGGGDTGYELDDYLGKLSWRSAPDAAVYQSVELKIGRTEQNGDETYLGLTDADFRADPFRRYAGSRRDEFDGQHDQLELRHYVALSQGVDLTTVLYRNEFARNWYKGQSVGGVGLDAVLTSPDIYADELSWLRGTDSPDDAIVLRANNREYLAEGVQTILGWQPDWQGAARHEFELAVRYHEDDEDRLQWEDGYRMDDGRLVLTSSGAPGSQANRVGSAEAVSVYLQDEVRIGAWTLTPGLRYESIDFARRDYAGDDPDRSEGTTRVRRTSVDQWIPGMGVLYAVNPELSLLASVHKGFNPPGPGSEADAEESVNYEVGARFAGERFSGEAIVYFNDYDNLVGTCTLSSGGGCSVGDQFDGGEVEMYGLELAGTTEIDLGGALTMPLRASYTYSSAEFQNAFASDFEEWGTVEQGDELPYLPEHQLQLGAGIAGSRWRADLTGTFVGEMRVVAGTGSPAAADRVDDHWVVDLAAAFDLTRQVSLFARIENLLDEEYRAARRPAGSRPGRPRTALVGLNVSF